MLLFTGKSEETFKYIKDIFDKELENIEKLAVRDLQTLLIILIIGKAWLEIQCILKYQIFQDKKTNANL